MVSQALDREVEAIIQTSNDQRRSRFDRLIEASTVLDLTSSMPYDRFFKQVAEAIGASVGVSEETLFQLLMEREQESSTALRPDLAIPHIIIEGRDTFHVLLARCKEGLFFSELAPRVRAVFVLVGTHDQRDYHLYVLSAIAEMVQQAQFAERWLKARNETTLRNIIKTRKV